MNGRQRPETGVARQESSRMGSRWRKRWRHSESRETDATGAPSNFDSFNLLASSGPPARFACLAPCLSLSSHSSVLSFSPCLSCLLSFPWPGPAWTGTGSWHWWQAVTGSLALGADQLRPLSLSCAAAQTESGKQSELAKQSKGKAGKARRARGAQNTVT